MQLRRRFSDIIDTIEDRVGTSIHHSKDSSALVKKTSIEDHVLMSRQIAVAGRRMLQPVLDEPSETGDAVTAVCGELLQCIALDNPSTEPDKLPPAFRQRVLPDVTVVTSTTEPALSSVPCFPVPPYGCAMTAGTMPF